MVSAFGNLNGSGNQQVWVNITRTGQNIAGNYSSYSAEVRYYGNGWGSWSGSTWSWSANFGGTTFSGTFNIPYAERNNTYKSLWSGSFNKTHNTEGILAAFAVSASITTDHSSVGSGTASTTEPAPPQIPRVSTPSFVGGANLITGTAVTINTNRASTSFTHDIQWSFGSLNNQTEGFSASTGVGESLTWTPPHSMLTQIPNAAVGSGTITLTTKSGSTVIGTKTVAFTVTAAGSIVPTISSVTLAEQNAIVSAQVGAYVQSLSLLRGTVNAVGVQGSTITDRKWSVSGTTVASGSDITVQGSGTVAVGAEATDSRGRKGTYATNITVLPYIVPKFNSVLVRRANSGGTVLDEGTYLRVDLNCLVQSLVVGTEKNALTIKVFTRLYGTSTWTARNVINHSSVSYNNNFLITGGAAFPVNQSFDVRIEINDKFNVSSAQTIVATAAIFMHWSATGVGIGKYHTQGALDVSGAIYGGSVFADGVDVRRAATDALTGVVELATTAEVQAGSDNVRVITPVGLASRTATDTRTGIAELATQAEVNAGTDTSRIVTPATLVTNLRGEARGVIPSSIAVGSGSASADANGKVTFTAVSRVSLNDVFPEPGGYEVYADISTNGASSVTTRMRKAGVDRSNADHALTAIVNSLSAGPTRISGATYSEFGFWRHSSNGTDGISKGRILLYTTALSAFLTMQSIGAWGGDRYFWSEGSTVGGGPFDGITIRASAGTLTGFIKVVRIL